MLPGVTPARNYLTRLTTFSLKNLVFCRIINVATVKPVLDTDHLAIFCKLRILYNIRKAIPNKRPLVKLDTDQLSIRNYPLSLTGLSERKLKAHLETPLTKL